MTPARGDYQSMFNRFLMTLPAVIGEFFQFALIVAIIGVLAFPFGESLPRKNFDYTSFPFAAFKWENDGIIYTRLKIQFWKDKVPDMSQYVKRAFRKKITVFRDSEYLETLILETCSAEFVHFVLVMIAPLFLVLMDSNHNWIWMLLYMLGNVPFILIQRYNRPRLVKLLQLQRMREASKGSSKKTM